MSDVTDKIYDRIYTAITEQALPPGTKLGEESLCEVFGVSRTPIRRVLLQLAKDHVVELVPHRGAFVARPTPAEARDVFAARLVLELDVARRLADGLGPVQVRWLEQQVALERKARERGERQAAIRLSGAFHVRLAELAGNQVVVRFLRELISRTSLIIALYEAPGGSCCPFDEHARLIRLIATGGVEAAETAMRSHLEGIEARLDLDRGARAPVELGQVLGAGHPGGAAPAPRSPRPARRVRAAGQG